MTARCATETPVTESVGSSPAAPASPRQLLRIALYLFVLLLVCPVRYFPLQNGVDATWRFALNYAAAQGAEQASQVVFTMGPLSYLLFPQDVGNNLVHGLLFQLGLWLVVGTVLADLFFISRFPFRNLVVFSFFLALAARLFWFNFVGTENLMLSSALILLVVFRLRGSWVRIVAALVIVGAMPLFKLSAAISGCGALAAFIVERAIQRRWLALRELAAMLVIVPAVAAGIYVAIMPGGHSVMTYLRGGAQIIGGYSVALSLSGSRLELPMALVCVSALGFLVWMQARKTPEVARFYVILLVLPLSMSFKHGFVRHDDHVVNFFCFLFLAFALLALNQPLDNENVRKTAPIVVLSFVIWQAGVVRHGVLDALEAASGVGSSRMLAGALRYSTLKTRLQEKADGFPEWARLEPELIAAIGHASVSSLSQNYTNIAAAGLRLQLYPVLQRYSAYTPYLDGLNAAWVRDHGPQFLVFDGRTVDKRDLWAETPAMWLEVYRWYDARLLGKRGMLLQRRPTARFAAFQSIRQWTNAPGEAVRFPALSEPVYWTMKCAYTGMGQAAKLGFRVAPVFFSVQEASATSRVNRVIPELLAAPVPGNFLPGNLAQFYALFQSGDRPPTTVESVALQADKRWMFAPGCEVELLRTVKQ